jgi:RNA polymerase sigma-70 factor (ECF subfamily)
MTPSVLDMHGGPSDPAPLGEQALVAGLRARDEHAYEVLVREHGGRLLATARRMLGNEEDARDVLQEGFLTAFRSISSFAGQSLLSTWLHRIVVNTALMKLRSRRCRPEGSIEDLLPVFHEDGHHVDPPCRWSDRAEQELQRGENRQLVREAVDALPRRYREVVVLRDLEHLSTEEAAQLLGVTPNAVKIRLHRARQALRTLLDRHFKDASP